MDAIERAILAYEAGPAKLRAACAGLSNDALNTRIGPGTWSAALAEATNWLHHVEAVFSTHRLDTPISRFGLGEIGLDELLADPTTRDDIAEVLALCDAFLGDTNGVFDITAVRAPNGSSFDPSGLVKGWSLQRAATILERHGAHDFTINGGGDIVIRGEESPGAPWRIGVRHPHEADRVAAVLALRGPCAIATSATYERGAHIIDPRSGEPTAVVASMTIVGPDLTVVDVCATTAFVMGVEGLEWLMTTHPECEGFVITHDGLTYETPGFAVLRAVD